MPRSAPELFVVAGEPSGDTHAAHLLRELRARIPGLAARGYGGPKLQAAGMELLEDLATDAVMGLFPVIKALPRIKRLFDRAVEDLRVRKPAALLLVDYPGFNLRLAAKARKLGVPVVYYISPQVWAWARGRIRKLARTVDLMLVILPFEADIYRESGLKSVYVGHPLLDHLATATPDAATVEGLRARGGSPLIGVFPGSRRHVVESLMPVFADAARRLGEREGTRGVSFAVAVAQEAFRPLVERHLDGLPAEIRVAQPYEVMAASDLCLTSSGTTTLEIAAFGKPFVIGYRVSPLLYAVGRLVVSVEHIGLVNLVAGRGIVPEHVGWRSFAAACADDLHRLWTDPAALAAQVAGLAEVRAKLDARGSYGRAADALAAFLD